MKILRQTSITLILFLISLLENYLNTFISLNIGIYIFFIALVFLGTDFFDQSNVIPIFFSGVLYDSFFSTYYLGLYSAIFLFVVIVSNYLVSKFTKTNIVYFTIISICLLIYKFPIIFEFDINYWLYNYLLSVFVNFTIYLFLKRILRINV